jgi:hypothetical protein
MLYDPLMWWCFAAVSLYIGDSIIKYAPPLKKWRAMEEGAQPPPWAVAIQNAGMFCAWVMFAPAIIVSINCLGIDQSLIVTHGLAGWRWLIISIAVVSIVNVTKAHTFCSTTKLLSRQLSYESLTEIENNLRNEIRENRRSIKSDEIAGFYSDIFHDSLERNEKTLAVIKAIISAKK